jgi:hypothetical protein
MKNKKWSFGVGVVSCLLLIAGCSASRTYEADYTYEVMKKAADGSVEVVGKGKSQRTAEGDAGGSEFQGVGMILTGARKVGKDTATIEVTYPDKTNGTLELRPKETKEHFHKSGEYGVRVTLTEIRSR